MQNFVLSTHLYSGSGALKQLKTLGYRKILLVTDRFFVENRTAEKIIDLCGAQVCIFDKVQPDPPLTTVAEGVSALQSVSPDAVIALGGGSAIDCAKGIVSMANSDADLIAIATTSGTGSEVTSFAVLTHDGVKYPLVEDRLRPKIAILDSDLLTALPPKLIADTGMDAVAHCIEAIAAKNASPFTDGLALHALHLLLELLEKSFSGQNAVRGQLHCAATMAGIAFDNAGLGICHALSHAIGGIFHLSHGRINAILLPAVMRFNASPAYTRAAKHCGLTGSLPLAVERLRRSLKLPASLTQAGLSRSDVLARVDEICDTALRDPCAATNPRSADKNDLAQIVRQVL